MICNADGINDIDFSIKTCHTEYIYVPPSTTDTLWCVINRKNQLNAI